MTQGIERWETTATTPVYIEEQPTAIATWNVEYKTLSPLCFATSDYDAHLFIKELGRRFSKNDTGVIVENKEKYIQF